MRTRNLLVSVIALALVLVASPASGQAPPPVLKKGEAWRYKTQSERAFSSVVYILHVWPPVSAIVLVLDTHSDDGYIKLNIGLSDLQASVSERVTAAPLPPKPKVGYEFVCPGGMASEFPYKRDDPSDSLAACLRFIYFLRHSNYIIRD